MEFAAGPVVRTRRAHVGLTADEAKRRLAEQGPNELPAPPRHPPVLVLAAQMTHFFAVMLWAAAVLAVIGGMVELGVAIAVVIVVNGVFAFIQEYRAERAAERLRDLLPRRATVRRDGVVIEIDAAELVVGDIVLLDAGDRVSADLEVLEGNGLAVDTSLLTGESVPERPGKGEPVYAGSFVVEGEAVTMASATASATRLGQIAALTRAGRRPPSPLARELDRVVRTIAMVAVGVGVAFFGIGVTIGLSVTDGFLFAVGVTVALVPEGLLPTVTLSLAMGAQRMAHRHALVRRLEAVETLGSTTFICTDKTGTLTRNQMAVVEVWTPYGTAKVSGQGYEPEGTVSGDPTVVAAVRRLALVAARASRGRAIRRDSAWVARGDPMEAALSVLATRSGHILTVDEVERPSGPWFAFDPVRRRESVVVGGELLVKGAPDAVLPRCTNTPLGATDAATELATHGLRVLAVAVRPAPVDVDADAEQSPDLYECNLELLGFVGLEDPPRPAVADSIDACRSADIRVAMVTGDHPATALAVAKEVGLAGDDALVLEGKDLPADSTELGELLDRDGVVLARVAPEDKLRIARALRTRGHVVAMTGDGVNDGPALREADIGVAMGASGTDVAREAADLVLLDDDFATIVAAVAQGRGTFANVRRFLTYHLTDNVAELMPFVVWALTAGRFPLALGVLQILALDIGTDLLPALALGAESPGAHVLERPLVGQHLIDRALLTRVFGVLGPAEAVVELAAFTTVLLISGWRWGTDPSTTVLATASGAAFASVVLGQMANAYACRSASRVPWRLPDRVNRFLRLAVTVELCALMGFLFIGGLAGLLDQQPPSTAGWLVAACTPAAVLAADALHKRARSAAFRRGNGVPRLETTTAVRSS